MSEPAPFIVWTLRRTGGTNLAQALFEAAPFPAVPHEPFNIDRVFGHVTRAWLADRDAAALQAALGEICARKVLIKHCVETVADFPDAELARAATGAGYRHVFLYRRHALDRLLSLVYAERSGVWGRGQTPPEDAVDAAFDQPLPVGYLLGHERSCRAALKRVHAVLRETGAGSLDVAFEDVFESPQRARAEGRLRALLQGLGLSRGEEADAAFVARVLDGGEQGTRDRYMRFRNRAELQDALAALGDFDLAVPD